MGSTALKTPKLFSCWINGAVQDGISWDHFHCEVSFAGKQGSAATEVHRNEALNNIRKYTNKSEGFMNGGCFTSRQGFSR